MNMVTKELPQLQIDEIPSSALNSKFSSACSANCKMFASFGFFANLRILFTPLQYVALWMAYLIILTTPAFALTIGHNINPALDVTQTTAIVRWSTDVPATSKVQFGTTSLALDTIENVTRTKDHAVTLFPLLPNTQYVYRFSSTDENGTTKIADNAGELFKLTTSPGPTDNTAPLITDITLTNLTATKTTISWTTNEPATTKLRYGILTLSDTLEKTERTIDHTLTASTISGKEYGFSIVSCDAANNCRQTPTDSFIAGTTPTDLNIANITLPSVTNNPRLTIQGRTRPGATVTLLVNGIITRIFPTRQDGAFSFSNVVLSQGANNISIDATEGTSEGSTEHLERIVILDTTPPIIKVALPSIVQENPFKLLGNTSEAVTFSTTTKLANSIPLPSITKLLPIEIRSNTVQLEWQESLGKLSSLSTSQGISQATQVSEYAVYRNNLRVGTTTTTSFVDEKASTGTTYTYTITVLDKQCTESLPSQPLTLTTPIGGSVIPSILKEQQANLTCTLPTTTIQLPAGPFSTDIPLLEGDNAVTITATDLAGNKQELKPNVILDTLPPTVEDNLEELGPTSYTSAVTLRGIVSEPATILVYVNDDTKPTTTKLTNPDGTFDVDVTLRREGRLQTTPATKGRIPQVEITQEFPNTIRYEVIDIGGHKITRGPTQVTYALCGSGNFYTVQLGVPIPDLLTPRLILQDAQQIGFTVATDYVGGYNATISPSDVRLIPLLLSEDANKKYDNDWVQSANVIMRASKNGSSTGYATIVLRNPESDFQRISDGSLGKLGTGVDNRTVYDLEANISQHRIKDCLLPGFGCVRLFLQLELRFQERIKRLNTGSPLVTSSNKEDVVNRVQKICVPIEVAIDKRIPPNVIPEGFLKSTVEFLGSVVDTIDAVLKPLTTIGTYLLYACLAGMVLMYASYFRERLQCDFSSNIETVFGDGWKKEVAQAGICDDVYDTDAKKAACNSCTGAIKARQALENNFYKITCDRIACPSAPSIMSYIRDKNDDELTRIEVPDAIAQQIAQKYGIPAGIEKTVAQTTSGLTSVGSSGISTSSGATTSPYAIYAGSDCAFKIARKYGSPKEAYSIAGQYNIIKGGTTTVGKPLKCDEPHPANPLCCGTEYMNEWGTACGLTSSNNDLFSEIKESTCVAAQKTPNGFSQFQRDFNGEGCNRLWNAAAGFCEPNSGEPQPELVPTGLEYRAKEQVSSDPAQQIEREKQVDVQVRKEFNTRNGIKQGDTPTPRQEAQLEQEQLSRKTGIINSVRNKEAYIQIIPVFKSAQDKEVKEYKIYRGYSHDRITYEKKDVKSTDQQALTEKFKDRNAVGGRWTINSKLDFFAEKEFSPHLFDEDINDLPTQKEADAAAAAARASKSTDPLDPSKNVKLAQFRNELCAEPIDSSNTICSMGVLNPQLLDLYNAVRSNIGITDQEYIVQPESGFLRSMQCVCLPAITSYLELWRNILGAVRTCFKTILITGDGSSGVCRAVLSQYACDLLYELISCFANKYSTPGAGKRTGISGIGNVLGALTAAGTDVSRSVRGRYGDTALYNTVFLQRKLMHSVCLFAFTGEWNLDAGALFKQTVDSIPIQSQGVLFPCDRRFQGFNPASAPSGLSTWTYHFGVGLAAGANLRYQLQLKCSAGPKCSEADGFRNGMCDCKQEKIISINPTNLPGALDKNNILNEEVFQTLEGGDADSDVRYDTAILSWEYEDQTARRTVTDKTECKIRQLGQQPPAFCNFEIFSASYRCSFGFGTSGIAIKSAIPTFTNTFDSTTTTAPSTPAIAPAAPVSAVPSNKIPAFGLGEIPSFDLTIRQELREGQRPSSEDKKFLRWVIRNQLGRVIAANPPESDGGTYSDEQQFFRQGEFKTHLELASEAKTVEGTTIPGIIKASTDTSKIGITKELFAGQDNQQLIQGINYFKGTATSVSTDRIDKSRSEVTIDSIEGTDGKAKETLKTIVSFTIDVEKKGAVITYQVFKNEQAFPAATNSPLKEVTGIITFGSSSDIKLEDKSASATQESTFKNFNIDKAKLSEGKTRFILTSKPNIAIAQVCPENPVDWTAEFTMHDSSRFGDPIKQISLNPATGEPATFTVPFKAVCKPLTGSAPAGTAAASPAATPTTPAAGSASGSAGSGGAASAPAASASGSSSSATSSPAKISDTMSVFSDQLTLTLFGPQIDFDKREIDATLRVENKGSENFEGTINVIPSEKLDEVLFNVKEGRFSKDPIALTISKDKSEDFPLIATVKEGVKEGEKVVFKVEITGKISNKDVGGDFLLSLSYQDFPASNPFEVIPMPTE